MEIITTNELAKTLRVCRQTIMNWVHRGVIPAIHVHKRKVLFDKKEVLESLRKRRA